MRLSALARLACPACGHALDLITGSDNDRGRVWTGELRCAGCSQQYPVQGGVPRFPPADDSTAAVTTRTRRIYDYMWPRVGRREIEEQWEKDSRQYIDMIPSSLIGGVGRVGLDAGCGGGADLMHFAATGAELIACDMSRAVDHVSEMTASTNNVTVVQADIHRLPFQPGTFDFVYSFGVLHHLPDPQEGFRRLSRLLKPGAPLVTYLYEDFGDRTVAERGALAAVRLVRRATSRLPAPLLFAACVACAPLIWTLCSVPAHALRPIAPRVAARMPFRHTLRLPVLASDLYDRFAPPEEHRYTAEAVRRLYEGAGLHRVESRQYRGWVSWGFKPLEPAA